VTNAVRRSIEDLPRRFLGSAVSARYRLTIDGESCDAVVTSDSCHIEPAGWGEADTEICTDAATWRAMDQGRLSGIEAFAQRRLIVKGSIDGALRFEPSFERPARGALSYELRDLRVGRSVVSAVVAGPRSAAPLLLLHGLGATKASWLPIVPQLAANHRVVAVDLPGFGASSKPNGRYSAAWFAERMFELLDALELDSALVAGNSMGGRIAIEMAMTRSDRVDAIACLCPATAFSYRPAVQVVRLLRPELSLVPLPLPRSQVIGGLKQLFAKPGRLHPSWYDSAVDDFLAVWRSPRARLAFFRSLRNIYLDEPMGEKGFWTRLSRVDTPALFIYGRRDALITHHFSYKVRRTAPQARVEVWADCGHVPQIEHPERTAEAMLSFFGAAATRLPEQQLAVTS
jgi:pimeloyl-ACP methyl ester carboxylesterase